MTSPKLYSAAVCPFAHRTRLVVAYKELDVEHVEIDLRNKPAYFDEISPYSKVPVLVHGTVRVWESHIINEYLDEVFPTPSLMPESPPGRADVRIWCDFADSRLVPAFYKVMSREPDDDDDNRWRTSLHEHLVCLDQAMSRFGGDDPAAPFFFGAEPTLADFALYPWFERWAVLETFRDFGVPTDLTRLHRWWDALRALPAVEAQGMAPEAYVEGYRAYSKRKDLGEGPERSAKI